MIDILQGEFLVVFCLTVNGLVDLTQFVMYVTYIKVNDGCHFEFDQADIFQGMKPHILFYGNGLAIWQGLSDIRHIKVDYG